VGLKNWKKTAATKLNLNINIIMKVMTLLSDDNEYYFDMEN